MRPWDELIPAEDRTELEREWGRSRGMGKRPAVLVVDMTYAFADDRFPLGCAAGERCAAAIAELLGVVRARGLPVLYTAGLRSRNPADRGLWKSSGHEPTGDLPDPHEIVPALAPRPQESVVRKRRPSAFFGTELASLLIHHGVDTVVLCGMVTSGCVRATAVDAFSHNFRVVVPEECVADRVRVPHAIALFDIHMKYGDVLSLDDVLRGLERQAAAA
jgi:maleamate amidohydrolase